MPRQARSHRWCSRLALPIAPGLGYRGEALVPCIDRVTMHQAVASVSSLDTLDITDLGIRRADGRPG